MHGWKLSWRPSSGFCLFGQLNVFWGQFLLVQIKGFKGWKRCTLKFFKPFWSKNCDFVGHINKTDLTWLDLNAAECLHYPCPFYQISAAHLFYYVRKKAFNFGASRWNHLDEQYGRNTSFWLPIAVCVRACVLARVSPRSRPQSFHPLPSCKLWSDIRKSHLLFFQRCVLRPLLQICAEAAFGMFWITWLWSFFGKGDPRSLAAPEEPKRSTTE